MTLDTTVAGTSAESYLSVADADVLATKALTTDPEVARWLDAATTTPMKEAALRTASSMIDARLRSGWLPYLYGQALLFPRSIDLDVNRVAVIPTRIRHATFEQAKFLLSNATVLAAARTRSARDIQSGSEPNVSWSGNSASSDSGSVWSSSAEAYLSGFQRTGRGLRSLRMTSGYPEVTW